MVHTAPPVHQRLCSKTCTTSHSVTPYYAVYTFTVVPRESTCGSAYTTIILFVYGAHPDTEGTPTMQQSLTPLHVLHKSI